MPVLAPEIIDIGPEELRNVAVDFSGKLDTSELLTGTPTVLEVTSTDLVLTNKIVSTGALTINGVSVAAGLAVQFTVDPVGATKDKTYQVDIVATSDASNAQDVSLGVLLHII